MHKIAFLRLRNRTINMFKSHKIEKKPIQSKRATLIKNIFEVLKESVKRPVSGKSSPSRSDCTLHRIHLRNRRLMHLASARHQLAF